MREDVKYAHIAYDITRFGPKVEEALKSFLDEGFSITVHYAQSTQIDGVICFSALIIGERTVAV
ncbi:hypothetical protein [Paenibacillus sp. TC-CSREp1]|uniref:hypothetical protein n=1 Tax=Paenibacillus sp. TC-CSREp1 TaxID=3410089 RepID=UPI003CF6D88F